MVTMSGEFNINNVQTTVHLNHGSLRWNSTKKDGEERLEIDDILCCKTHKDGKHFELIFVRHSQNNKLVEDSVVFSGSLELVRTFSEIIQLRLTECKRPRNLLIFVNPTSGHGHGYKDYKKRVRPILERCGVRADVRVTKKIGEPTEILSDYDLTSIDGVVTMGGDGSYCECLNGLIARTQADAGVDLHDPSAILEPPTLPIGILPAGSGDYVVQYLNGTRCLTTAVLRILLGKVVRTNSASLHESGQCLAHSGLVLGFGLFGDMMYNCEKYRWMGSSRYNVIPLASLLKRRTVRVEVDYLPSKSTVPKQCQTSCAFKRQISLPAGNNKLSTERQLRRRLSEPDLLKDINEWRKTSGRVYAVDTHPIAMVAKDGRMRPCFGHESLNMTLTEKCSISKHIAQLTKVKDEKPDCYDFDFVRRMKVDAFRVRLSETPVQITKTGEKLLEKGFYVNCDGEAIRLRTPQFEVRFHREIVALFGSQGT